MAELEIHHEGGHAIDPMGQKVGVLAALLAVLLAVVTIASHRTHTAAIMEKATANDHWQYYQASRIKFHNLELGESLIKLLGTNSAANETALADYAAQKKKYTERAEKTMAEAREVEEKAEAAEQRAMRYDFGEGLLEIGLVLTSLYFISRKVMFPVIGVVAGLAGIALGISGLMLH